MKGQISLEMFVTLGIVLAFTLPVILLLLSLSQVSLDKTAPAQAEASAKTLADSVNEVYAEGGWAQRTVFLNLPAGQSSLELKGSEVVFDITTSSGAYQAAAPLFARGNIYTADVDGNRIDRIPVRGVIALVVQADGKGGVRVKQYGYK